MFWTSFYILMILFIIVSLFLILLILIQKGRGGGLASAFGGGGGNTAFGSKTGDVLTWATSIVFGVFLLLAVVLNLMANSHHDANTAVLAPAAGAGAGADAPTTSPSGNSGPLDMPASQLPAPPTTPDIGLAPSTQPAR